MEVRENVKVKVMIRVRDKVGKVKVKDEVKVRNMVKLRYMAKVRGTR